jgi:predicted phage baseplate assembly protein
MPLPAPVLDDRNYNDLVHELIARIPSHTPEWTNFNDSDPGITLIQLFAHLGESLIYRSNRIPERNRAKFLSLLGVKLNPAQEAKGLVSFANERGPAEPLIIEPGAELFAGEIAFSTVKALDALPLETQFYVRRPLNEPNQELMD